jgi:hypothetical protein
MLQTIRIKGHVNANGILTVDIPIGFANQDVEGVLVMQPPPIMPHDANGWPVGFFTELDRMGGDDVFERPEQGTLETREAIEDSET